MFYKLALASAFVLSLSAGAMAQTGSDGDQESGQTSVPSGWIGPIGEAFYTDGSGAALRPEAEAKANFAALSPELQAQVKSDCTTMSGSMDSTASTGTTAPKATENAGAGASGAMEAQGDTARQVCSWVGGM